ncbi:MAG: DVUA0089 family protein [Planctomycetes bacterium]|nr:DVUA0089 family protein [Planctomycetota bacterium]
MKTNTFGVVLCALIGCAGVAIAGPDWLESGDAGSSIRNAQIPTRPVGAEGLLSISGALSNAFDAPDYEDLYFIRITNPANFVIRPAFADFDPVLYLFNVTLNGEGYGLLGNDNESNMSNMPKLRNMSTDGTQVIVQYPGDYVLAVTTAGRFPVSRTGAIFNFASDTEISGPDGPGGINPLEGWQGSGRTGRYGFTLEATDFPATPAPGALGVLGVGLAAAATRRRRA